MLFQVIQKVIQKVIHMPKTRKQQSAELSQESLNLLHRTVSDNSASQTALLTRLDAGAGARARALDTGSSVPES